MTVALLFSASTPLLEEKIAIYGNFVTKKIYNLKKKM